MDRENQVPAVSITGAENWTGGEESRQCATGKNPETNLTNDSVGIDLPGVGVVRPGISSDCTGRDGVAGEATPRGLVGGVDETAEERLERLTSQLIFAARDLAQQQIEPATDFELAFCTECGEDAGHEPKCCTGRVFAVLAEMVATLKPSHKEAATDGEQPGAGDGIRPRGPVLLCVRCGAKDGEQWLLVAQTSHRLESALRNNQCELSSGAWWLRYEHRCEGGAR